MKRPFLLILALFTSIPPSDGAVLLNDLWADGDRTDTLLPEESAWFASNAGTTPTLSAAAGALTGNVLMFGTNAGSRLWLTYFTPAGTPTELAIGDTLKATLVFVPNRVATAQGSGRGLRIGLFNFSEPGAGRAGGDGFSTGAGTGAPGANVTGYLLNTHFGETLAIANPLQIMKRTDTPTNNLMGASAVYSTLGSGGGAAGAPGFRNGIPYKLEFSATRYESTVDITTRFSDNDGWSISHTATDFTNPTFRFDAFALRPNSVAETAESFAFTQFKVEVLPFAVRINSVQLQIPDGLTLTWTALPGKTYQVEWRNALASDVPWIVFGSVTATSGSATYTDSNALFEPQGFYRVVELP